MYRVQAWNVMGGKLDDPSPAMELKQALVLAIDYKRRGLRRITLIDVKTGDAISDLEHLIGDGNAGPSPSSPTGRAASTA